MFFAKPYTKVIRLLYEHRAQLWVGILVMAMIGFHGMRPEKNKTVFFRWYQPLLPFVLFISRSTSAHEHSSCNHVALAGDSMHKMYFSWKT